MAEEQEKTKKKEQWEVVQVPSDFRLGYIDNDNPNPEPITNEQLMAQMANDISLLKKNMLG